MRQRKLKQSFAYGHDGGVQCPPGSFIRPPPPRVRPSALASPFPSCLFSFSLFKVRHISFVLPHLASQQHDLLAFEYHNFSWFRSVLHRKVCKGQQTTNAETDCFCPIPHVRKNREGCQRSRRWAAIIRPAQCRRGGKASLDQPGSQVARDRRLLRSARALRRILLFRHPSLADRPR